MGGGGVVGGGGDQPWADLTLRSRAVLEQARTGGELMLAAWPSRLPRANDTRKALRTVSFAQPLQQVHDIEVRAHTMTL